VDRPIEEVQEVTAIDNLGEGRLEKLAHLKNNKRFRLVKLDRRDTKAPKKVIARNDVILHIAVEASIRKNLTDHRWDLEHNVIAMINLLEVRVKNKVNDLVFANLCAVYGKGPWSDAKGPKAHTDKPLSLVCTRSR